MSDGDDYFDHAFARHRVMAILRGYSPEETVARIEQAWAIGVDVVEVPIETPKAMPSLEAALALARERGREIGAGTIRTVEQLEAAAKAGVAFTVAPGLDPAVSARSAQLGLPHMPGVATATEIQSAVTLGHTWIKAFPASFLGPAWFRAIRAPFPDLKIVATGGVSVDNAPEFLASGVDVVALGSSLADPASLARVAELLDRSGG